MSFKDILKQQQSGLEAMASTGVIGLHLVSGPAVGFAIGYGLDRWLDTSPWCKFIFLVIGICAGFLNVYRDTRSLLKKMAAQDARRKGLPPETAARTSETGADAAEKPAATGPEEREAARGAARPDAATPETSGGPEQTTEGHARREEHDTRP